MLCGLGAGIDWILGLSRSRRYLSGAVQAVRLRRHARSVVVYVAVVLTTLVALEAISWAVSVAILARSEPLREAVRSVWQSAWREPRPKLEHAVFSPLTQVRRTVPPRPSNDPTFPYIVNRLGLIDNEGASAALDTMPEKPLGMIRVILY